jgi:hypothetical protein
MRSDLVLVGQKGAEEEGWGGGGVLVGRGALRCVSSGVGGASGAALVVVCETANI